MIFHDKHTLHHNISIVIVVIVVIVVMIIVILIDRSSQTFLLSLCDVVIRLVDGFLYRATLKKTQQKKFLENMPPSHKPVRFKSALRVQFTSILEGGGWAGGPANYSSRNDDGKYFEEIEEFVCLEMI